MATMSEHALSNIPKNCFHKAGALWGDEGFFEELLDKYPLLTIAACGGEEEPLLAAPFGRNDTVALLAVVLKTNHASYHDSLLAALDDGKLAGEADMSFVIFIPEHMAQAVLPLLDDVGAFLAYDETGSGMLSGKDSFFPPGAFERKSQGIASARCSYDTLVPMPALASESSSVLKTAWTYSMFNTYLDICSSSWLFQVGLHSIVPFGEALNRLVEALFSGTNLLSESQLFFEDELPYFLIPLFSKSLPIGTVNEPSREPLGLECSLIEGICAIWASVLSKYSIKLDIACMIGGRPQLDEFCHSLSEFGKLAGIDEMATALASGVPVEDIVA